MKALVLAGGSGTRLRPFSHSTPKQLIPIANRPVLEYVLDNVRDVGVTEVGVVVGDRGDQIEAALGDGARLGLALTYVRQDKPRGLAHAVAVARPFLGDDDFVLYLGDVMVPDGVGKAAADFRYDRPAAQLAVHQVPDPRAYGVVEVAPDGSVVTLTEKPEHPRGDLVATGVYFFTPEVHKAIASITPSPRGELEITDAIHHLVTTGHPVRATRQDGFVRDTGRIEDVLDCNRFILDRLHSTTRGTIDGTTSLTGQVHIETGARIVNSKITGPTTIGSGTTVQDSQIGPHTTLGKDCTVTNTRISDSIVLEGARVHGAQNIQASIIGRSAQVKRSQTRQRLIIGDHSKAEL